MNIKKACFSFLVASGVPWVIAMWMSQAGPTTLSEKLFGLCVFYFFVVQIVFPSGFVALFIVDKIKHGRIFVLPIFGLVGGWAIAKSFNSTLPDHNAVMLITSGFATSMVAAVIYFGKMETNSHKLSETIHHIILRLWGVILLIIGGLSASTSGSSWDWSAGSNEFYLCFLSAVLSSVCGFLLFKTKLIKNQNVVIPVFLASWFILGVFSTFLNKSSM